MQLHDYIVQVENARKEKLKIETNQKGKYNDFTQSQAFTNVIHGIPCLDQKSVFSHITFSQPEIAT